MSISNDIIEDIPKVPKGVIDAAETGKLVLFIGAGDVELIIDSIQRFQDVKGLIEKSFAKSRIK